MGAGRETDDGGGRPRAPSPDGAAPPPTAPRTVAVAVPLAAAAIFLWGAWFVGQRTPFWEDEILSYLLVTSPTLHRMMQAIIGGAIDGSPPLYALVLRLWAAIGGTSEVSLRMPSALFTAVAFLFTWAVARRQFGFWPASIACTACFFASHLVAQHFAEARNYALLLMLTAAVLWHADGLARTRRPAWTQLALHALLNAALVFTHLFGFFYGAALLLAAVCADLWAGRLRVSAYLSVLAGWIVFLPWVPSMAEQADGIRDAFWLPALRADQLLFLPRFYLRDLPFLRVFRLALLASPAVALLGPRCGPTRSSDAPPSPTFLLLAGVGLVAFVPALAVAVSFVLTPIWFDRYMVPGVIGWALLAAYVGYVAARLWTATALGRRLAHRLDVPAVRIVAAGVCIAITCVMPLRFIRTTLETPQRPPTALLPASDAPFATEDASRFLSNAFYQPRQPYYFLLDWDSAAASGHPNYKYDNKLMAALRRNYPDLRIVDAAAFAAAHDRFYYVKRPGRLSQASKVLQQPDFVVTRFDRTTDLIERRPNAATRPAAAADDGPAK